MQKKNESGEQPKANSKKKWIFLGLGLLATGLTIFTLGYFKKKKSKGKEDQDKNAADFMPPKTSTPKKKPVVTAPNNKKIKPGAKAPLKESVKEPAQAPNPAPSGFPLIKGSKGDKVKAVQQSLISKHGKSLLPKFGADGIFGSELQNALKKLKLPESIDETLYNVLVQAKKYDARQVASLLNSSANTKAFDRIIVLLKTIPNTTVYSEVNKYYLNLFTRGVRQTVVNAMLGTFQDQAQKQTIRLEFVRMGLKYDGKKWSLSGIDTQPLIITTTATKVWKDPRTAVGVPANMVLGKEVTKRGSFTLFENDKQYFLVESKCVSEYKA